MFALDASSFHIRLRCRLNNEPQLTLQTRGDASCSYKDTFKSDFQLPSTNFPLKVDRCENILQMSNSPHASFCTVKVKNLGEVKINKTHFWIFWGVRWGGVGWGSSLYFPLGISVACLLLKESLKKKKRALTLKDIDLIWQFLKTEASH